MYAALLAAYRDTPGNHRFAAQQAGVFWRTARRGWEEGWPAYVWAARPIKDIIKEEQAIARQRSVEQDAVREASLQRELEDASRRIAEQSVQPQTDRELVRQHALETREAEALAIRLSRSNAIGLLTAMGDLVPSIQQLTKTVARQIETITDMTPGSFVRLLREFASAVKMVNEATDAVIKMERLVLGEPTQILGLASGDMTRDEAIAAIMAMQAAALGPDVEMRALPAHEASTFDDGFVPESDGVSTDETSVDLDEAYEEGSGDETL